jgi:hypothetical protein
MSEDNMTQEPRPIVEIKKRCQASALDLEALSRDLRRLAATLPAPAHTGEAAVR